jgi:hypothetical protein
MLRLTIVRTEPNPKYVADYRGYGLYQEPSTLETQVLSVELTDEEWRSIKRAVIEVK